MNIPNRRLAAFNPLIWLTGRSVFRCGVLSADRFHREVLIERSRASRRAIPFCVITINKINDSQSRGSLTDLASKLVRNLRHTDQVGWFGGTQFGVLLVDTAEMGGRQVIDRLDRLLSASGHTVLMNLRVHDLDGFGDSDKADDSNAQSGNPLGAEHSVLQSAQNPFDFSVHFSGRLKRMVDLIGATLGLIILGPMILIAMALVRLTSRGPAIFRQIREGRGGKPFTLFKIRTMCLDAESMQHLFLDESHRDGPAFKVQDDPRITPIGRWLRASCIDELPQLWNVLVGDMSLVGPRPLPIHESRACLGWYRRRLDLKPGLTCYWQIDKANVESFEQWMRLDLRYVNESSFLTDLGLIAKTVRVPLLLRGNH